MIEINGITEVMNHVYGLKAVVFDLDDTLYSEKEYIRSGFRAVAEILTQVKDAESKLWSAFEAKKNAIDEVLGAEGIYTEKLKQICLEAYRSHDPDIHLYDGVEGMLGQLRRKGVKIGIITDGRPKGQWAKIKVLNLEQYADRIIVTDELGGKKYRKPAENAFIVMRVSLGVDYCDMCYVGDNKSKDFSAPIRLNMIPIFFRNGDGIYNDE